MAVLVAVANPKGGVGKSTLVVHLAVWLADHGVRVLVVDGDCRADASRWLGEKRAVVSGLARLWRGLTPGASATVAARWGVHLLPGGPGLEEALSVRGQSPSPALAGSLQQLAAVHGIQVLLLDLPPGWGRVSRALLQTGEYLLVPTSLEEASLAGLQELAEMRRQASAGPRLLGVIPTLVRPRTREHGRQLVRLVQAFGPLVWPALPLSIRVAEAAGAGVTVWEGRPGAPVARALATVCERFVTNLSIKCKEGRP